MRPTSKFAAEYSRRAVIGAGFGGFSALALSGLARPARAENFSPVAVGFDAKGLLFWDSRLLRSDDDGLSWTELPSPGEIASLATHPGRPGRIIAGLASKGVALSHDGGRDWMLLGADLPSLPVHAVTVSAKNPDLIYAAVEGDGLWKSEDAGESWLLAMDRPWLAGSERDPLTLASVNLETGMGGIWIYAGTEAGLTRVPDCFCRWQDVRPGNAMDALVAGAAPPPVAPLPDGEPVLSIASVPSAPERLYAALPSGVWESDDGGVVWTQMIQGSAAAIAVHPEDRKHIVAVIDGTLNLTHDGGKTWTASAVK